MSFERIRRMMSTPQDQKRETRPPIGTVICSNGEAEEFKKFINIHQGDSFVVCGCGSSLNLYDKFENHITIGVNDASSKVYCKYLVVVNEPKNFKRGRWENVNKNTADYVFTHIQSLQQEDEGKKVIIKLGKRDGVNLDNYGFIDYTNNSPYMATIIAYQMGARKIGLIGVDFTLNHFFGETGKHTLNRDLESIINQYSNLANALVSKGIKIANLSPDSMIEFGPKMTLADFETI
jgi:hypothetical protein